MGAHREVATLAVRESRVLNATQAAEFLSVSRRWLVREGVRKQKIPFLRPPGSNQLLFLESDLWRVLESWLENAYVGTPPRGRAKKR